MYAIFGTGCRGEPKNLDDQMYFNTHKMLIFSSSYFCQENIFRILAINSEGRGFRVSFIASIFTGQNTK